MKKIILAGALIVTAAFTTTVFAAANSDFKSPDQSTGSQGSQVGVLSSRVTGNGAVVGGAGTNTYGGSDQTTSPGSRADAIHNPGGTGLNPGKANGLQ